MPPPPKNQNQTNTQPNHQTIHHIKNLQLRAKILLQTLSHGIHQTPTHGFSVEFTEYRQYTPGDDPRHLDWKLYARTDRHYIKKHQDETNLRCHLLIDQTPSMQYTTLPHTKAQYTNTLAATLAHLLHQQGDAIGILTFTDTITNYIPPRNRPGHLRRIHHALQQQPSGNTTNLKTPLQQILKLTHKPGLIILISDLLTPDPNLTQHLTNITANRHELHILQTLDPAERHFNLPPTTHLQDIETKQQIHINPKTARTQYLKNLNQHLQQIKTTCQQNHIHHQLITTNQPPQQPLHHYLKTQQKHRHRPRPRRPTPTHHPTTQPNHQPN